jgi:hypothetical protein
MPEIITILIALAGIFFVGAALTAIKLVKNATQFFAISLLMFFVILLANRSFSAQNWNNIFATGPFWGNGDRPLNTQPISRPGFDGRMSGRDLIGGFTSNVGNFSDSLDNFVYGPQAKVGWQTLPEKLPAKSVSGLDERRVIAPTQRRPVQPEPTKNTPATSGSTPSNRPTTPTTPTNSRPVSAWW